MLNTMSDGDKGSSSSNLSVDHKTVGPYDDLTTTA
jgi:hypothetical protein